MKGNAALKKYTKKKWMEMRIFYNVQSELIDSFYKLLFKKGKYIKLNDMWSISVTISHSGLKEFTKSGNLKKASLVWRCQSAGQLLD